MMKKNKKQKFTDFHEYSHNNKSNKITSNNQSKEKEQIESNFQQYETPIQTLQRLFPTISLELIENIYEESSRTYITTKMILEEMTKEETTKAECESSASIEENKTSKILFNFNSN